MLYLGKGIASLAVDFDICDNTKLRDMLPKHYIRHLSSQVAYVDICILRVSLQTSQMLYSRRCTKQYPIKRLVITEQLTETPVLS